VHGIWNHRNKETEFNSFLESLDGTGHTCFLGDVTDSVRMAEISSEIPKCDILVNAAGKTKQIPHFNLMAITDNDFDEYIKTNLKSVFIVTKAFIQSLQLSENAVVFNISSASSLRTGGSNVIYAAAKAGVDSLTRNFALAFSPGVRFISLNPSAVNTGFLPMNDAQVKQISSITPLKRIATVEDVANAIEAFTTVMRFSTGNCFVIDGGRIL